MAESAAKTLTIRQIRSGIGFEQSQKATLKALGLGRVGRTRSFPDNAAVRGMVRKVTHLVEVVETVEAPSAEGA